MDKVLAALNDLFVTAEREFVAGKREAVTGEREESIHKISQVLEEEGITSPAQYTDLLLKILEHERLNKPVRAAGIFDPLRIDQKRNNNLMLKHRVPDVPFHHNGLVWEPNDVKRFDGDPLHWAMVGKGEDIRFVACDYYSEIMRLAQRQIMVNLIATEAPIQHGPAGEPRHEHEVGDPHEIAEYYRGAGTVFVGPAKEDSSASASVKPLLHGFIHYPAEPPRPPAGAQFFENENFGGHWLWLEPGYIWPDLDEVDMGGWGLFTPNWNDKISSLKTGDGIVALFDHHYLEGSSLTFFGAVPIRRWREYLGYYWTTEGRQAAATLAPGPQCASCEGSAHPLAGRTS